MLSVKSRRLPTNHQFPPSFRPSMKSPRSPTPSVAPLSFTYNYSGELEQITDIVGIKSSFAYSVGGNFVSSLTTPYGVTGFTYGDANTTPAYLLGRWIETVYPDGKRTRTEYDAELESQSSSDSAGVPSGMYPGFSPANNEIKFIQHVLLGQASLRQLLRQLCQGPCNSLAGWFMPSTQLRICPTAPRRAWKIEFGSATRECPPALRPGA